jgi:putative transposase
LLAGLKVKGKSKKSSPGQMGFPWAEWEMQAEAVHEVAEKFVVANCYNPQVACQHRFIRRDARYRKREKGILAPSKRS